MCHLMRSGAGPHQETGSAVRSSTPSLISRNTKSRCVFFQFKALELFGSIPEVRSDPALAKNIIAGTPGVLDEHERIGDLDRLREWSVKSLEEIGIYQNVLQKRMRTRGRLSEKSTTQAERLGNFAKVCPDSLMRSANQGSLETPCRRRTIRERDDCLGCLTSNTTMLL